jgi:hypothetical protein
MRDTASFHCGDRLGDESGRTATLGWPKCVCAPNRVFGDIVRLLVAQVAFGEDRGPSETSGSAQASALRQNRVRTRLLPGGRWIRTIGPRHERADFCCGKRIAGPNGVQQKRLSLMRYRWFESISLQQRVHCEPDLLGFVESFCVADCDIPILSFESPTDQPGFGAAACFAASASSMSL